VWLVLLLLVPFMIESIRGSVRKTYLELEALNEKLDRLIALLERDRGAATPIHAPPSDSAPRVEEQPLVEERPRAERVERVRKEPTISG
jgi:hypothetical protein